MNILTKMIHHFRTVLMYARTYKNKIVLKYGRKYKMMMGTKTENNKKSA